MSDSRHAPTGADAHAPEGGVPDLPWLPRRRRSLIEAEAAPLLVAALRRVAAVPLSPVSAWTHWKLVETGFDRDLLSLDTRRATRARLAAAAGWHRLHPQGPRPFLHNLLHAGYVLRALKLTPSRVHQTRVLLQLPADASDTDLLTCAHLSTFETLTIQEAWPLVHDHRWTVTDLLAWSATQPTDHYRACADFGVSPLELRGLLRAGQVPTRDQLTLIGALADGVGALPVTA